MAAAKKLHLYHRLQLAAHRIQKAADRALLAAAGVTTAQAAVLAIVNERGAATQREVAKQLGLNESAVTSMVTRLQAMSLLERVPHESDARAWSLCVSKGGRAALRQIETPFDTINARIESELAAAEVTRLADYLARLSDTFEKTD